MHVAAQNDRRDLCVMLVAAGANIEHRDLSGNTAMMVAFNKNYNEIASYLESKQFNRQQDIHNINRNYYHASNPEPIHWPMITLKPYS